MRVALFKHWLFLSVALSGLESSNARCSLFIAQGYYGHIAPQGPTDGPRTVAPYTVGAPKLGIANDDVERRGHAW
jgi:hypothetical protein